MLLWLILIAVGLAVVVTVAFAVKFAWEGSTYDADDAGGAALLIAVLGTAAAFIICSIGGAVVGEQSTGYQGKQELIALTNDKVKEGGYFFLGTGVTDEEPVYRYLAKDDSGAIRLTEQKIRDSVLFEGSDGKPFVREETRTIKANFFWPWDFTTGNGNYEFHIPKGSITSTFEVSVK